MRTIPVLTTYMEMFKCPELDLSPPFDDISLERSRKLTLQGYRDLYRSVGDPYKWIDRIIIKDDELRRILDHTEIYILRVKGEIAGYLEIERKDRDVEIVYLGLIQRYHGKGLGWYLLNRALEISWEHETKRVWLHTCEWDHEGAIPMYKKIGFKIFREDIHQQTVPDEMVL